MGEEGKAGRPAREFSDYDREIVQRLATAGVTQNQIAEGFNCDPDTLRKHCREELDQAKEDRLAPIRGRAFSRAMENDVMTMFVLKTQDSWRETNRTEITGADGGPVATKAVDAPPQETMEQWTARKVKEAKERANGHANNFAVVAAAGAANGSSNGDVV